LNDKEYKRYSTLTIYENSLYMLWKHCRELLHQSENDKLARDPTWLINQNHKMYLIWFTKLGTFIKSPLNKILLCDHHMHRVVANQMRCLTLLQCFPLKNIWLFIEGSSLSCSLGCISFNRYGSPTVIEAHN
jgi:hypothetical protein